MNDHAEKRRARSRTLSLLLALTISCSLSALPPRSAAAEPEPQTEVVQNLHAATPQVLSAVDKLVELGLMQGDYGNGVGLNPDRNLTRAEFTALVNRAYGYTQVGPTPFVDVPAGMWYSDDIAIAYNAGFFYGDGNTLAMPLRNISRQDALVLLGRNMRMEQVPGQPIELSDGNDFSDYARGYARAAAQAGIIDDDNGNGFRPQDLITRGEMAQLLLGCTGVMVREGGEQSLGDVFGNVTVSAPNTILKDTTIAGDLYISGGIGLGGVTLENVNVLGKIVVAGGGVAEGGSDSVILRNVEAESLLVDSISGNYLSLRSEGDTSIADAVMRTSGFVLDRTDEGYGLLHLTLDSAQPAAAFTLAGNLKEVVNKTAGSVLNVAQASVAGLVIDEEAVGSTLNLAQDAAVKQLSLDTAVPVTGAGDIDSIQINTLGSSVEQLPDKISVRPGLTALVSGEEMDNKAAIESSTDPRLLAGYPKLKNIAPTSATAVFSTNKKGTVYWAVSAYNDGSIPEDELIEPKAYGSRAILQGSVPSTAANTEVAAALDKLTKGGSYYLSAVMVDARGLHSPYKVTSFETPDDTVPAFIGKPVLSKDPPKTAKGGVQIRATTNKSCVLYYALLPEGRPVTVNDFKTASFGDNKGSGTRTMTRNVEEYITINPKDTLAENTNYTLHLWLTDADGAKSSAITTLPVKTGDETPPGFTILLSIEDENKIKDKSVAGSLVVDEDATVFWVAVPLNSPYPVVGTSTTPLQRTEYAAKTAVENALGGRIVSSGKKEAKKDASLELTIDKLEPETPYTVYYVAKDKAGNYSKQVERCSFTTLDNSAPTVVSQTFINRTGSTVPSATLETGVRITFSESVTWTDQSGQPTLLQLYEAVKSASEADKPVRRDALADALRGCVKLYSTKGAKKQVNERTASQNANDWTIDYRYATVEMGTGANSRQMSVTFPVNASSSLSALNLRSGETYQFELFPIFDTATRPNALAGNAPGGVYALPAFSTSSASVLLSDLPEGTLFGESFPGSTDVSVVNPSATLHGGFSLNPIATSKVSNSQYWDMLIWSDYSVTMELYGRTHTESASGLVTSSGPWHYVGAASITANQGQSLTKGFRYNSGNFENLNRLDETKVYDFAFRVTKLGTSSDPDTWSDTVNFRINAVSGDTSHLTILANTTTEATLKDQVPAHLSYLSVPESLERIAPFTDKEAPYFLAGYPKFDPGDTYVKIETQISRAGTVYYAIIPASSIPPTITSENNIVLGANQDIRYQSPSYLRVPTTGIPNMEFNKTVVENGVTRPLYKNHIYFPLSSPDPAFITELSYASTEGAFVGSYEIGRGGYAAPSLPTGSQRLKPETDYVCYFVIASGHTTAPEVQCFRFSTTEVTRPVIELSLQNPVVTISSTMPSVINYALMANNTSVLSSVLTDTFADVALDRSNPVRVAEYEKLAGASTMSVLDAMSTDVSDGRKSLGSVFDLYASETYKERAAVVIRSSTSGSGGVIVGSGSLTLPTRSGNMYDIRDCSGTGFAMAGITQYVFVAVGRNNTGEGSGDAFRAIAPVFNKDTTGPMVIATPGTFTVGASGKIHGTFTVTFDSTLYQYIRSGNSSSHKMLDAAPLIYTKPTPGTGYPDSRDTKNYVSLISLFRDGSTSTIVPDVHDTRVNQSIESVTFTVTGAPNGAYVQFDSSLSDEYDNTRNDAITIQLNVNEKYQGGVEIYVSPAWDDRQKTVGNHNMPA